MEEKYVDLKLNEKEINVLRSVLSKIVFEDMIKKTETDYEEKVAEDYDKYSKEHKEAVICGKILDIINYLER